MDAISKSRHLINVVDKWIQTQFIRFNIRRGSELTSVKCNFIDFSNMAVVLKDAFTYAEQQNQMLKDIRDEAAAKDQQLLELQKSVIKLQKELLLAKDEQLY